MSRIEPIRRSVSVTASPERAFELFTDRLDTWWPLGGAHSRAPDDVKIERVEFQGRVGGQVIEHLSTGEALPWAEVLTWEPPVRFVLAWKPNSNAYPPTEVEVRFTPQPDGTLVELEHRGWERLADLAEEARAGYASGWIRVLARFEEAGNREAT